MTVLPVPAVRVAPDATNVRVLVGFPRVRAVRKAYTILEAIMAYRMIV
jgi:hypothetical protein